MSLARRLAALLLALSVAAGCAAGPAPGEVDAVAACLLAAGGTEADPHAGAPTLVLPGSLPRELPPAGVIGTADPGVAFVAAHVRATLLRRDCTDRTRPGLAARWSRHEDGRVWQLELREDARRPDGRPYGARDVILAWGAGVAHGDARLGAPFALLTGLPRDSVTAIGPRRLRVALRRPAPEPPAWLAAPELALADVRLPASPGGPGTWRVQAGAGGVGLELHPPAGSSGPSWRVLGDAGADVRDLLDRGVDLVLTADPAVAAYAAGPAGRRVTPLPPGRTVLLLVPGGAWSGAAAPTALDALRAALARDAVPVLARPASPDGPWADLRCGGTGLGEVRAGSDTGRIVYRAGDPAGRAVAERLVALAAADGGRGPSLAPALPALAGRTLRAVGLGDEALRAALGRGLEAAYVVTVAADPPDVCGAARLLEAVAPWLRATVAAPGTTAARLVPLIDTRLTAVFRDLPGPVALGPDGLPRLPSDMAAP